MRVGEYNSLTILRATSVGMYLGDDEGNDVLLPHKYIPDNAQIGENLEVFIYRDSEDRLIATNLKPALTLNQFAVLEVAATSSIGAFLDWGLEKDLFVPFREQNHKLEKGQWVTIYLYLDKETDRLVGSAKINKFFKNEEGINLKEGQEVDLLVIEKTDLGHNVAINNSYKGLMYENETFKRVAWGDTIKGYIKTIREDNRIDVSLQPMGFLKTLEPNSKTIIEKLTAAGGTLQLSDSTDPIVIMEVLEMSKKSFKKAIGSLYKEKKISLDGDSISLIN